MLPCARHGTARLMEPIKELNRGLWNLAAPGEINDDGVGRGKRVRESATDDMDKIDEFQESPNLIFLEDL